MVVRRLILGWVGPLTLGGCVLVEETGSGSGIGDGPFPGDTGTLDADDADPEGPFPASDTVPDDTADSTDSVDSADTGEEHCGANVLGDGGFESGTPNPAWAESSPLFDTPICNDACSEDPDAAPYGGTWFAWFGGAQQADVARVSQTFVLEADAAQLTFRFAINAAAGTGDDVFAVTVDGNTVFMRTDADIDGLQDYTLIPVTLDQWADGQPHTLAFQSEVFGDGLTNFFVDDVSIVGCGTVGSATDGTTSGSSSSGAVVDDTGGGTSTGGTSTGETSTSGSGTSGSGTSGSGTSGSGTSGGSTAGGSGTTVG